MLRQTLLFVFLCNLYYILAITDDPDDSAIESTDSAETDAPESTNVMDDSSDSDSYASTSNNPDIYETLTTDDSDSQSDSDSAVTADASVSDDSESDESDDSALSVTDDSQSADDSDSNTGSNEDSGDDESADSLDSESDSSDSYNSTEDASSDNSGEESIESVDEDDTEETESSQYATDPPEDSESDDQDTEDDTESDESIPDVVMDTTSDGETQQDIDDDDDTQSTTTSTTTATSQEVNIESDDFCAGLSVSECGEQHDDDGNQLCAQNVQTNACYEVVESRGEFGRGGFDTGYAAAQKTEEVRQNHLHALIGIFGAILGVLALIVFCGGCYLFGGRFKKQSKVEKSFNRWSFSAARVDKKTMSLPGCTAPHEFESSHMTDTEIMLDLDGEGDTVPMITTTDRCSDTEEELYVVTRATM